MVSNKAILLALTYWGLFLKTHGTAVSCYTGEEERKQQSKEINCLINV